MALTKAHNRMIADSPANAKDFGAVGNSSTDDTAAIQAALDASDYVIVPAGDYRIDGTITIEANKTLELRGGLYKFSAYTSDTGPVVKLFGNYAMLRGNGSDTYIQTQNDSPDGIILIGAEDPSTTTTNFRFGQVRDLRILGSGSTVVGSKGISIQSSEYYSSGALYEFIIKNIYIFYVNTGIHFGPIANGHIVDSIQFWDIGQGIVFDGIAVSGLVTDNNVSNIFVDNSPNMTSLVQLRNSSHSSFVNVNGEATAGRICDVDGSNSRITFVGVDNHASPPSFTASLSFFAINGNVIGDAVTAGTLTSTGNAILSGYINLPSSVFLLSGTGSPEGAVTAARGSLFMRADGGAGTSFYVKESGTGNTGWVAK